MEAKVVQKFGNGGHVVLSKEYVGRKVRFLIEPRKFGDIKREILEILSPYLDHVLGVYLYGSYARNEQTLLSDVDVLVVTDQKLKLKIMDKRESFSIISVTLQEIESMLKKNAILILPIIKEAKTIVNPNLLEPYKKYNFNKKNSKWFIETTESILRINEEVFNLGEGVGSLVYSLILRIRGLLMIKIILGGGAYSKSLLFSYLESKGFLENKVKELYKIYSKERENIKINKSNILKKEDINKLLILTKDLLKEIKELL